MPAVFEPGVFEDGVFEDDDDGVVPVVAAPQPRSFRVRPKASLRSEGGLRTRHPDWPAAPVTEPTADSTAYSADTIVIKGDHF